MRISNTIFATELILGFLLIAIFLFSGILVSQEKGNNYKLSELKKWFSFRSLYDLFILGLKEESLRYKLVYFSISIFGFLLFIFLIIVFFTYR
jgi:hypothetical protein